MKSLDAEQQLIGALLIWPESFDRIVGKVSAHDFSDEFCGACFGVIHNLILDDKPVDTVTVAEAGNFELAEVGKLAREAFTAASIEIQAATVRDFARRRRLADVCRITIAKAETENSQTLVSALGVELDEIGRDTLGQVRTFSEVIASAIDAVETAQERRKAGGYVGVPWGIPALDHATGGLCAPRLIGLAARPGIGKTALMNQVAVHAASMGHAGLILSLEMGEDELGLRALANRCRRNFTKLSMGIPEESEGLVSQISQTGISEYKLYVDTSTFSLDGIVARITECKRRFNIEFAIVDHIGLIESTDYSNRNDQIGAITRTLKKLCKKLNIPIVAVSQLNRGMEKENRKPRLADLRDSGNIEQDLDICLMLHSEPEQIGKVLTVEMGLLKNRAGIKAWLQDRFEFDGAKQTFRQLADYDQVSSA